MKLTAFSQDYFGALHSNYSPANTVHANPSSMLDTKTWLDIYVVGLGVYVNNNFIAAQNTTLGELTSTESFATDDLLFNTNGRGYHIYTRSFAQLFSGVYSQGDHAAGISFGAYNYADIRGLSHSVGQLFENEITAETNGAKSLSSGKNYSIEGVNASFLVYGEAKISYAYTFKKNDQRMFMGGISLKKIFPITGVAFKVDNIKNSAYSDSMVHLGGFTADLMIGEEQELSLRGGAGLDLGFTYQKMKSTSDDYYPNAKKGGCKSKHYQYKIGLSINDLGYAKFNPNEVEYYGYQIDEKDVILEKDLSKLPEILNKLSSNLRNENIKKPHKVSLPTSLSRQFDYNLYRNFLYVNGTWTHGIYPTKRKFGPRRAHALSITPRIETKWFDFSVPVSLYEYQKMQVGMNMRIYFLTIGTDKLLQTFVPTNIFGADVFLMLKMPIYYNPMCKKARKKVQNRVKNETRERNWFDFLKRN